MNDPNLDPNQINKAAQSQETLSKAVQKTTDSYGREKDAVRRTIEELKQYERVTRGVTKSHESLIREIDEFNSKQKDAAKKLESSQKEFDKTGKSVSLLAKKAETAKSSLAKAMPGSPEHKRASQTLKNITKELELQKVLHKESGKNIRYASEGMRAFYKHAKDLGRYQKHYNDLLGKPTKNYEDMNKLLQTRYMMEKRIAETIQDEETRTKKLIALEKDRDQTDVVDMRSRVSRGDADSDALKKLEMEVANRKLAKGRETLGTGAGMEFGKGAFSRGGAVKDAAGALLSKRGSLKDRYNAAVGMKDAGADLKDFKKKALGKWSANYDAEFSKAGKKTTVLSKAVKGMAGNFELLKMVIDGLGKGNILMAVVSALAALAQAAAKAVYEIDIWYKDINKKFYNMAGSSVGMVDSTKSMKKFGAAVFDMNRNIKLGLKSEQIYAMFNAFTEAGMSLQGFLSKSPSSGAAEGIDEYSDAITTARSLSIKMGVDFEKMGGMMGDAMTNLRMNMDEVRDTFSKVAYDAANAGIQTNKFYGAISAATSSLSFYGKFLGNASAMLTKFTKQGLMGFEDASKQVQSMMGGAAQKDTGQALGAVMLSRDVYDEESVRLAADQDKQAADAEKNVEKLRNMLGEAEKSGQHMSDADKEALKEKIVAQSQLADNAKARAKRFRENVGNVLNTANDLAMYEAVSTKAMVTRLKKLKLDLTSRGPMETVVRQYMVESGDMDKESAQRFVTATKSLYDNFITFADGNSDLLAKFGGANSEAFAQFEKGVKDFAAGADFSEVSTNIRAALEKAGYTPKEIDKFETEMKKNSVMFSKFVEGSKSGGLYTSTGAVNTSLAKDAALEQQANLMTARTGGKGKESEDKQMDEVIGNTRSMADIFDISKESIKYSYAQSDTQKAMVGLATGTLEKLTNILGLLTSWFNKANPALQKKSDKFMAGSDDKKYVVGLFAQKFALEGKMAEARQKGQDTTALGEQLKAVEGSLDRQEKTGRFADVFSMNKQQLAVEGRMVADKMATADKLDTSKPEEKAKQDSIYKDIAASTNVTPDKMKATGDLITDYLFMTALGVIGGALGSAVMPGVGTVAGAGAGIALGQALTGDRMDSWKDLTGADAVGSMTKAGGNNVPGGKAPVVQSVINIGTSYGNAEELQKTVSTGVQQGIRIWSFKNQSR